jgi:hypothetical protein
MRLEKGSGINAGFGLVVAVAMVSLNPFPSEFGSKPVGALVGQFEDQTAQKQSF